MFFKVSGTVTKTDKFGRHFIDVIRFSDTENPPEITDNTLIIKFSEKNKYLSENIDDGHVRVFHCNVYEWKYNGKTGKTNFCYKIT